MSNGPLADQRLESALEHNHFVITSDVVIPQIPSRKKQVSSRVR